MKRLAFIRVSVSMTEKVHNENDAFTADADALCMQNFYVFCVSV